MGNPLPTSGLDLPCAVLNHTGIPAVRNNRILGILLTVPSPMMPESTSPFRLLLRLHTAPPDDMLHLCILLCLGGRRGLEIVAVHFLCFLSLQNFAIMIMTCVSLVRILAVIIMLLGTILHYTFFIICVGFLS